MSEIVPSFTKGSLRDHLMQQNKDLAEAANHTWRVSQSLHDRQTKAGENMNGRAHVEAVELNIWRLLTESSDRTHTLHYEKFSAVELYLLSCAACCHDFDKGLQKAVMPEGFTHGAGSGIFVCENWRILGIETKGAAEAIDDIVRYHNCKEDFSEKLEDISEDCALSRGPVNLRRLAALLKAADILHCEESRISYFVPDHSLKGKDLQKQLGRKAARGWKVDGSRVIIEFVATTDEEWKNAKETQGFIEKEWLPVGPSLERYEFPHDIYFETKDRQGREMRKAVRDADPGTLIPPAPYCFGRDAEINELVSAVLQDDPKPVPVLGGPGIGKTTLTIKAYEHEDVVKRFGDRRYFIRCDGVNSCEQLAGTIALGMNLPIAPPVLPRIFRALEEAPNLLILDNLETPWELDRSAVEEFLGMVGRCRQAALVVSVRGSERPHGPAWRKSVSLARLTAPADEELFLAIAGDEFADDVQLPNLCGALEGVPLAIHLMAHVAEGEPDLEGLWRRWEIERTAMLKRPGGKDRLDNLEVSYEISINGNRMDSAARRLLSVLSLLPAGVGHHDLPAILPGADRCANTLRKAGLAFDEAARIRVLAPLREYVAAHYPPDTEAQESVIAHYMGIIERHADKVGGLGGAEAVTRLEPETANVEAIFPAALESAKAEEAIKAAVDWAEFLRFTGFGSASCIESAARTAESLGMTQLQADCIKSLGDIALQRSNYDEARDEYKKALSLYYEVGDILGEANCIGRLGEIALQRSNYDEARDEYKKALPRYHEVGDILGEANCIGRLGEIALRRSNHGEARKQFENALPLYRQMGNILGEANCIQSLGHIALERSNHDEARDQYEKALPLYRKVGSILGEADCIRSLGEIALRRSNHDEARKQFENALELYHRIPEPFSIGWTHERLVRVARDEQERQHHIESARESWKSIDRPDLIASLDKEFGTDG